MDRTTIKDIARLAGVSPGAVSFALNDKPGVSDSTRARVKAVAKDLGGVPMWLRERYRPIGLEPSGSSSRATIAVLLVKASSSTLLPAWRRSSLPHVLPWCCSWSHHVRRNARSIVNGGRSDGLTVWS